MPKTILDASAILALLNDETGALLVQELLPGAVISTVNLAEVVTRLIAAGMPEPVIHDTLTLLGLEAVPFDEAQAYQAGFFSAQTRPLGLSLGDRACLALARAANAPALTADQAWTLLDLGVEIHLLR